MCLLMRAWSAAHHSDELAAWEDGGCTLDLEVSRGARRVGEAVWICRLAAARSSEESGSPQLVDLARSLMRTRHDKDRPWKR